MTAPTTVLAYRVTVEPFQWGQPVLRRVTLKVTALMFTVTEGREHLNYRTLYPRRADADGTIPALPRMLSASGPEAWARFQTECAESARQLRVEADQMQGWADFAAAILKGDER